MKTKDLIQAVAMADSYTAQDAIAALPYDILGDDYRRDPIKACRKALRMTSTIARPPRRLRAIDRLLGMHGVEIIRGRGNFVIQYANSGDSYACTVLLFPSGAFRVSSWGDVVETRSAAYGIL